MKIIGGMAAGKSVVLMTEEYRSQARLDKNGNVTATVEPTSRVLIAVRRWWFMPLSIKFFVQLIMSLSFRARLLLLFFFVGVTGILFLLQESGVATEEQMTGGLDTLTIGTRILTIFVLLYVFRTIGGYHAAEHMAIHAYEKFGTAGLQKVGEQSRIHPHCGGRMLVPLFVVGTINLLLRPYIPSVGHPFLLLGTLEVALWVDKWIGYQNIWLTQKASELLQQFITTKPPNEKEVAVGTEALRQLMVAEGQAIA